MLASVAGARTTSRPQTVSIIYFDLQTASRPQGACTEPLVALRTGSANAVSKIPRNLRGSDRLGGLAPK